VCIPVRPVRVRFAKKGRAVYISHLDLNRCMSRALVRAGIPVWHTQGFNPHPYITFALPLSLFFESECEVMDMKINGEMAFDEIRDRLAAQMPEGIEIREVGEPEMKAPSIAFARYEIRLVCPGTDAARLSQAVEALRERESVPFEKVSKRHTALLDLKPYWLSAQAKAEPGLLRLEALLPASPQETLNPTCLTATFAQFGGIAPEIDHITRLGIYNGEHEAFR
jgi:radical SAM-linked protein